MPIFFIDTDDGDKFIRDEKGHDLSGRAEARHLAMTSLPDMAHDKISFSDRRAFTASVRDQSGAVIYSAALTLSGMWHD